MVIAPRRKLYVALLALSAYASSSSAFTITPQVGSKLTSSSHFLVSNSHRCSRIFQSPESTDSTRNGSGLSRRLAFNYIRASAVQSTKKFFTGEWTVRDAIFGATSLLATMASTAAIILNSGNGLVKLVSWLCITLGGSSALLQRKLSSFESE